MLTEAIIFYIENTFIRFYCISLFGMQSEVYEFFLAALSYEERKNKMCVILSERALYDFEGKKIETKNRITDVFKARIPIARIGILVESLVPRTVFVLQRHQKRHKRSGRRWSAGPPVAGRHRVKFVSIK